MYIQDSVRNMLEDLNRKNQWVVNQVDLYLMQFDCDMKIKSRDKLLFFENFLNHDGNRWCCKYQFSSLYIVYLINLLAHNDKEYKEFTYEFWDEKDAVGSIWQYRKYKLRNGKGQGITADELKRIFDDSNITKLHEIIEDYFCEPIATVDFIYYKDIFTDIKKIEQLMEWHQNNPDGRFLRSAATIIKSFNKN